MKTNLYQVADLTAETVVGPIFTANRDGAAIRIFYEILKTPNTDQSRYPEDFALLKLGEQDMHSGAIEPHAPVPVTDGKTYLELQKKAAAAEAAANSSAPPAANDNGAANGAEQLLKNEQRRLEDEYQKRLLELRHQIVELNAPRARDGSIL